MRRLLLFLMVVFLFILGAGISTLPEVFRRGYAIPGMGGTVPYMPSGLYVLILANLVLFVGVLLSIVLHHWLRPMIGLFVVLRVAEIIYEYTLDRHSLWYLVVTVTILLVVGGGAILLLTQAEKNRNEQT